MDVVHDFRTTLIYRRGHQPVGRILVSQRGVSRNVILTGSLGLSEDNGYKLEMPKNEKSNRLKAQSKIKCNHNYLVNSNGIQLTSSISRIRWFINTKLNFSS